MNREQAFMEAQIMYGREIKKLLQHIAELQKQLEETKQTGSYQVMLMCQKENILLNQQLKQSQNQKTIEVLEKVKDIILNERKITSFKFDIFNKGKDTALFWLNKQIDNQINELKGKVEYKGE